MPDFWRHSGFHLLDRSSDGRLKITDDFLRAYLLRPEIRPVDESGPDEIALHGSLMDDPHRAVDETALARIEDPDARDNYRVLLDFFDRLRRAGTLESCYAEIFSSGNVGVPPLFIDQLAHIILRNILDGCENGLEPRAAEIFFREQKAAIDDGAVMLADAEAAELRASGGAYGNLGRLILQAQTPIAKGEFDVLDSGNADAYWGRDDRNDWVIGMNFGRAANTAFCRILEKWVWHFLGIDVVVTALRSIEDSQWAWHVGLDAESTALLNDLWRGEDVDAGRMRRVLALFRLDFADPASMRADVAGRPVYLALSMAESGAVRMKPQNLLLNLPLARRS